MKTPELEPRPHACGSEHATARWGAWARGVGLLAALAAAACPARAELRSYETKYYALRTDVDADTVREISRRVTLMAEQYHERTRGFAGAVQHRLPLLVFRNQADYVAAGGLPNTAGVFMGDRLMVLAGEKISAWTWHVVQHEGFHQFVHAAIGTGLPPWANEGLAEYFGEGLFTGDDFYTGLIPPERLEVVRAMIRKRTARPLTEMMRLGQEIWNAEIGLASARAGQNYTQAWAMVHFLAHAENGRYQQPFTRFLAAVSRGQDWQPAWVKSFGAGVEAFQQKWEAYWTGLDDDPTDELYARATLATLTSFYARAFSQRQFFDSFEAFVQAGAAGQLKFHAEDWLPPALLADALRRAPAAGEWSLEPWGGRRTLKLLRDDQTALYGQFRITNGRVQQVDVISRPGKKPK